jgi:hypothetical protein
MPLISTVIPGLFNGISQQPSTIRLLTQGELQENCDSNLVTGLTTRVPTEHLAYLGYPGLVGSGMLVHTINRGDAERYIVVLLNGDLKVFDLNGVEKTVQFPNGKGYLANANPDQGFRVVTIADYSFIVNSAITVAMDAAVSPGAIAGTVQLFSDLPPTPAFGSMYEITGDPTNTFDNYYVERTTGVWVESPRPGVTYQFNAATMPHQLVRQADGVWVFDRATWSPRAVGDSSSSPQPSFVGRTIRDVFFHRNRLGFVAAENVIFSRSGEFFNFWRETVLDVLHTDPVDVSVAHTKVSNIHSAIPYNKSLMLFSEQTQFVLTGADVLSPTTVKIDQTTEFETSGKAKPVASGPNVYFVVERGGYAGFKEYYVADDTASNDASDITKHCPSYVPAGVYKIAPSSNEDVLFALTKGERNAIYVYRYYWQGTDKKQSSWSKWTFPAQDTIVSIDVINTVLYLVIQRADGFYLEKMDIQALRQDAVGYLVSLDRRVILTGTYSGITNLTTWVFPYDDVNNLDVVLGNSFGGNSGALMVTSKVTNGTLTAVGNWTAGTVYGGRPYTMRYRLSEQHVRNSQEQPSVLSGKLQLRYLTVDYTNTGNYSVQVTPSNRTAYTSLYPYRVLGTGAIELSKPLISRGRARIPILANSAEVSIELLNDKPMPCSFQSLEWTGYFTKLSQSL